MPKGGRTRDGQEGQKQERSEKDDTMRDPSRMDGSDCHEYVVVVDQG